MSELAITPGLEVKYDLPGGALTLTDGDRVAGYASVFGRRDGKGDAVEPGAFAAGLERMADGGRPVRMLWQHDPAQPIGVWDTIREDAHGLYVAGRLIQAVARAAEAAALLQAGAIDGLSIGYRTRQARKDGAAGRTLTEVELWEVSLVTFPMLPDARVGAKADRAEADPTHPLADAVTRARRRLAGRSAGPTQPRKGSLL